LKPLKSDGEISRTPLYSEAMILFKRVLQLLINKLIPSIREKIDPWLAYDSLKKITWYHRLQGSTGLWDAVNTIKNILSEHGVSSKILKVKQGEKLGFLEAPASWDPVEGWVEIKDGDETLLKISYDEHPTLISAHSPGGEGEAKLSLEKEGGEAIIATGLLTSLFEKHRDSRLIVYYTRSRYAEAVPYTGLFLRPGDTKGPSVVGIPTAQALRIIEKLISGRELIVSWNIKVKWHDKGLPVLYAGNKDPRILFVAHICHPKPGAHDNGSGSAALIAIAKYLEEQGRDDWAAVWVPEYTGSIPVLNRVRPKYVVNLDMVGSKQWITGSTLSIVAPPLFVNEEPAAAAWAASYTVFNSASSFGGNSLPRYKWEISPYTMGSDHDVALATGIPATMFNEWPSKYYHTDMDTFDTISRDNLNRIVIASLLTYYILEDEDERRKTVDAFNNYRIGWYYLESNKKGVEPPESPAKLLSEKLLASTTEKPLLLSPITSRKIMRILGTDVYEELRKIKGSIEYIGLYAPLLYSLGVTDHERIAKYYQSEKLIRWRDEEWEKIKEAFTRITEELLH